MDKPLLEWTNTSIAGTADIHRIQNKVRSDQERFSFLSLQEDIESRERIFVLLNKTPVQIAGIIELFRARAEYPGLYYSKTPPEGGRSITYILPEILRGNNVPCKEIAFPSSNNNDSLYLASFRNIYERRCLKTDTGDTIEMYVATV